MPIVQLYKQEFRTNLRLALPIIGAQVGQITVHVADTIMVGHLGYVELAGVSLGGMIFILFYVVGIGLSFALTPLVAEAHGKNDPSLVSSSFKHSMVINIFHALFVIVLLEAGMPQLLYHLGQEQAVVDQAIPYLRLCIYSLLPFMIFQTFRTFSEGMSETVPPMIAILIGNVLNIFMNYVFIFGKFGVPAMGVEGAALGTLLSRVIMLAILIGLLMRWKNLWSYIGTLKIKSYSLAALKKVLALGVPTSFQMLFEILMFAAATVLMGIIGTKYQAAHQIVWSLITIPFMACIGFGAAATIRVGNQLGAGAKDVLKRAGYTAIIMAVCFMFFSAIVFILTRSFLPAIFIQDPQVVSIAATLLIVAAIFQIADGVQVTAMGALRGLQDVKIPTVITLISYLVIGLPICYIAAFPLGMGAVGVWIGLLVGITTAALLNVWRFKRISSMDRPDSS